VGGRRLADGVGMCRHDNTPFSSPTHSVLLLPPLTITLCILGGKGHPCTAGSVNVEGVSMNCRHIYQCVDIAQCVLGLLGAAY
jgi:hypothetical protein